MLLQLGCCQSGFSSLWKGHLLECGELLNSEFWGSNWVKGSAAREFIEGPLTQQENNLAIAKNFQNGKWVWGKISFDLPRVVTDKIQAIPRQLFGEKEHSLTWKFSHDGSSALPRPTTGSWIWKFDTLPKIRHFIWLCFHNSALIRQVINARGINCNMRCALCQDQEEYIIHLLRDFLVAINLWKKIGTPQSLVNFIQLSLLDWIKENCLYSNQILANGIP